MILQSRPTIKQYQVYQALSNPEIDVVFFGGAAGGGKTWLICESRLINCLAYPGYKSFIGREELKRLMQSTYQTWVKVCNYHKVSPALWKLNGQYNFIEFTNGSRIDLLDLKLLPTDPMYERFGSLEYTDGAIEEAGEIDFLAYDVLKSRIGRTQGADWKLRPTMLITGNPKKNWTYSEFYKLWKKGELPKNHMFVQALFGDNQWTAEEYGRQLSMIKDKATKQRLMYGNWEYDDDPNTLIKFDAITDLATNTVPYSEEKYLTADIARYGSDKVVVMLWKGMECYKVETWTKQGIDATSLRIKEILAEEKIPYSHAIVDDDGVGGGVVDILRGIKGFVNNSTPLVNPITFKTENYQNLKTQCYYLLADAINDHQLAIKNMDLSAKELLVEELEQVKSKDADKDGKLKLVPKEEVKEIIGRSPDYSDALMMRMWFQLNPRLLGGTRVRQHIPQGIVRNLRPQMS